jgi:AcrR family transcriptional regulator
VDKSFSPSAAGAGSLHQRTKDRMRAEAADIAIRVFLDRGFDDVTVDDLCAAVGLSRRSFFRYFKAKEDIVLAHLADVAEKCLANFSSRPGQEELWLALRRSMDPFVRQVSANSARALALLRLIQDSPTLRAAHLDRVDRWRAGLAAAVVRRRGLENADLHAAVLASAAMGALTAAVQQWADDPDPTPLADLVDQAFAAIAPQPARRPAPPVSAAGSASMPATAAGATAIS